MRAEVMSGRVGMRAVRALVVSLATFFVFFLWRSNVLNPDGYQLTRKLPVDVPIAGAHLTHDEMLELLVHSRFWHYTNQWWGWSVAYSYQVLSSMAGVVFLFAVLRLARRLAPGAPAVFVAGILSGGYMQLFFGDVENYTLTTAIVALYLLAACRFLSSESPLWVASTALAVGVSFHLEAAWLAPSLLFLFLVSRQRSGSAANSSRAAGVAIAIGVAVLGYLHFNGLPLQRILDSHLAEAARGQGMFAVGEPWSYYEDQLRLLFLLCPAIVALVPLVIWRQNVQTDEDRFLLVAALSMLLFQAVWKAQLGVFNDWNLYAMGGFVASAYLWRRLTLGATVPAVRVASIALILIGAVRSYLWIASNHAGRP